MKAFKKIALTLLLAVILVSTSLTTVFAAESYILTANSDLTEISIGNDKYIKYGANFIYNESYSYPLSGNVTLGSGLENYYSAQIYYETEDESIINVSLSEKNGGNYSARYVHQNAYESIKTLNEMNRTETVSVFNEYSNEKVIIDTALLEAEILAGKTNDFYIDYYYDYYTVCQEYRGFYKIVGYIIDTSNKMYYMPITEGENGYTEYDIYSYGEVEAFEITNETLIETIEYSSNDDDYNVFAYFLVGLLVVVFIIIPLVLLILSIIFSIKTKGIYKKLWISVLILSALLLISIVLILALSAI